MKKLLIAVSCIAALITSCSGKPGGISAPSGGDGGNAATVAGEPITMDELNSAAKAQLQKVETQVYQVKKRMLDDLIETKLIDAAAKKAGKGAEEFVKAEIESKAVEPTENEIKALYDARKDAFKEPYEKVKDQISGYLKQNHQNQARMELIEKLRGESDVKVFLEPPRIEIDVGNLPGVGDKDAKIKIIEFSDYQCPFCKRVRPTIWGLMDEYKDKIYYTFVDFPLSFHQNAKKAHEAARCAGEQGKYYELNRKIFDNQTAIGIDDLKKYAKQLNLKTKEFDECLDKGKFAELVEKNTELGVNSGVSGTPAYFINGIMLSGAQPQAAFKEIIDEELKK